MKVYAQSEGGEPVDITEGVRVMYDAVLGSMDWQSGFLDLEELEALGQVADACGFDQIGEIYQRIQAEKTAQEAQAKFLAEHPPRPRTHITEEERERQRQAYQEIARQVQARQAAAVAKHLDDTLIQRSPIPEAFRYFKETPS